MIYQRTKVILGVGSMLVWVWASCMLSYWAIEMKPNQPWKVADISCNGGSGGSQRRR